MHVCFSLVKGGLMSRILLGDRVVWRVSCDKTADAVFVLLVMRFVRLMAVCLVGVEKPMHGGAFMLLIAVITF